MAYLEFEVQTKRHTSQGETLVDTHQFTDLDAAQKFVNGTPILVPPEDVEAKRVKYFRIIRRTKAPAP